MTALTAPRLEPVTRPRPTAERPVHDVLPHGALAPLAENVWRVEGSLPHFDMRRVMAVARRRDGRLVIHSAIALEEPAMMALERLGEPAFLLVPHTRHRLDAPFYKRRYPKLCVLATRGALEKASEVVPVDGTYEDFPADEHVSLGMLAGTGEHEGWMRVHPRDGVTLVLNEVVADLRERSDFVGNALIRLLGLGPGPRVSPVVKLELVRDREALRADLFRLSDTPGLVRVVVSHERTSFGISAAAALRSAARSL